MEVRQIIKEAVIEYFRPLIWLFKKITKRED
mgnify:CR=1 FL=1